VTLLSAYTVKYADIGPAVGRPLRRVEDLRLVQGRGRYVDDLAAGAAGALHMAVLRSPHAHAAIAALDTRLAAAIPGVAAVVTAADLGGVGDLPCDWVVPGMAAVPRHPVLARDRVRYAGQPVAAVAAATAELARDALEAIEAVYAPLDAVTDPEAALAEDAPRLHAEAPGNRAFVFRRSAGDFGAAAKGAAVVVRRRIRNNRLAPACCLRTTPPRAG
jgi:aerobic carbon-monoxide dehydrogenase large subunit